MNDPKPCPFCGGTDTLYAESTGMGLHYVLCDCGVEGPPGDSEAEAARLWNARQDADALLRQVCKRINNGLDLTVFGDKAGVALIEGEWQRDYGEEGESDRRPLAQGNTLLEALEYILRYEDDGDWEYPGQAYRHLLAEFNDLRSKLDEVKP